MRHKHSESSAIRTLRLSWYGRDVRWETARRNSADPALWSLCARTAWWRWGGLPNATSSCRPHRAARTRRSGRTESRHSWKQRLLVVKQADGVTLYRNILPTLGYRIATATATAITPQFNRITGPRLKSTTSPWLCKDDDATSEFLPGPSLPRERVEKLRSNQKHKKRKHRYHLEEKEQTSRTAQNIAGTEIVKEILKLLG